MPPFLFVAAAVAVGYFGYRKFLADAEKVSARVRREEKEQANRAHGTLVQDPETGEYRPVPIEDDEGRK
ncbi:MAG: hypothetical protein U5K75_10155 [Ahrensia sp.]|nr:hypothetical protein [Ahrensia sp.]